MGDSSYILPALVVFVLLGGMRARIDVYDAFVRGAKEGLCTLLHMAPYLCAILTAAALLRETGVLAAVESAAAPLLSLIGIPKEAAPVVLIRPLSGSASLAAVAEVMRTAGADSRAARIACVISGASETILFTASLYLGAAGVRRAGHAAGAALAAYIAGLMAAGAIL